MLFFFCGLFARKGLRKVFFCHVITYGHDISCNVYYRFIRDGMARFSLLCTPCKLVQPV